MFTKKDSLLVLAFTVLLLTALPTYATQIDPLRWEQMTVGCDLAGIVECTKAGGIVAEYKVIDAWKGSQGPEPIRIHVATNYWEPQFPLALIGEQYLVFAYKNNTNSRLVSTTMGGPVPLWWRNISSDYRLPLFQGRYKLDKTQTLSEYDFGNSTDYKKKMPVSEVKKQVQELANKTKQQQEVILFRILFKKYFLDSFSQRHKSNVKSLNRYKKQDISKSENPKDLQETIRQLEEKVNKYEQAAEDLAALEQLIQSENDPIKIIDKTFDFYIAHENYENSFESLLGQGIQNAATLENFKKRLPEIKSEKNTYIKKHLPARIEKRITNSVSQPSDQQPPVKTYTAKELDDHQKLFTDPKKQGDYKWSKSFEILIEHRPVVVAKWLKKWKNHEKSWRDKNRGYELGSYFAFRCKQDKTQCLEIMLNAKNDYIRAAAAIYLVLEDEQKGVKQLKKMAKLKGDPGAWASLNLARRGNKDHMDDMIKEFSDYPYRNGSSMVQVPHRNLLKRAEVLLSNSAAKSNIPKPPTVTHLRKDSTGDEIKIQKAVDDLQVWWAKNRKQIKLYDPWLETLKKQKVD